MRAAYPCPEWLSETILRQAAESGDPEATAVAHSIARSTLQWLCGESEAGPQVRAHGQRLRGGVQHGVAGLRGLPCPRRAIVGGTVTARPQLMSSESGEWDTPPHIVDAVRSVLGGIDLDPASSDLANRTVRATRYYTKEQDGFLYPWCGRVYMNPPYGREIGAWVEALRAHYRARHVSEAIALLPARTDTAWWRLTQDYPVCFLHGRLHFSGHATSAPFPSALVYLGPDARTFAEVLSDIGTTYSRMGVG